MGISRYNASGYLDMTAHLAVQNMEREEKVLHIEYPTGYMNIRMDVFFPCTVKRADKLFRIVRRYCTPSDKDRLLEVLRSLEKKYTDKERFYSIQVQTTTEEIDRKCNAIQRNEAKRRLAGIQRNIRQFEVIVGSKEV